MLKHLWALLMGDTVQLDATAFSTGKDFERYVYSDQMIAQINAGRRYQILSNRRQTEIYVVDTLHKQRVGRFYDISYALLMADQLNQNDDE